MTSTLDPVTPTATLRATVSRARAAFHTGRTRPPDWRRTQLRALDRMLVQSEAELCEALRLDLGKPALEGYLTDIAFVRAEIAVTLHDLDRWLRPERVKVPVKQQPARARIHRDPLGTVLIIGPWNYPIQLVLAPLVGAIAGGNTAVIKPSEVSAHTSRALAQLLPQYLDPDAFAIVEGGVEETTALLDEPWDHIFYTGNGTVGRVVMAAAAKHLSPVTLELGGKSPVIVDRSANLDVAAKRIVWGKFLNAGQTCVAPDYVLVDRTVEAPLLARMADAVRAFYGTDPRNSPDYGRIVNDRHFERVSRLADGDGAGEVVFGGIRDGASRYFSPTALRGTDATAAIMQEEIFGPVLPTMAVDDVDDALDFVTARDKPLALYVFAEDPEVQSRAVAETTSGGVCVNATLFQITVPGLPFGGVGPSGMGAYHGRSSFDTFTHRKSVLRRPTTIDPSIAYPPYSRIKAKLLRKLL
ncbi:MAG: aldehyde dehydrogenase family protein [Acidimicrobiia bacterium]